VLNIQRMSTEDGPGIRTTVFFKGCSLACDWCQNPESLERHPEVIWQEWRCIGCRGCLEACPQRAITFSDRRPHVYRGRCRGCGTCAQACPTAARELLGSVWELDALVDQVDKDRTWFESSGGGVTCSGGEPGMQAGFVELFLRRLRDLGIHAALDTCGLLSERHLLALADASDLVLYDVKLADPALHARHTGHDNARILDNLRALAAQVRAGGGPETLWVRTPLIPGVTASEANLRAIGGLLAEALGPVLARWDLCAFNNLCAKQYERLGQRWPYWQTPLLTQAELDGLLEVARGSGVPPDVVFASGPTRAEG